MSGTEDHTAQLSTVARILLLQGLWILFIVLFFFVLGCLRVSVSYLATLVSVQLGFSVLSIAVDLIIEFCSFGYFAHRFGPHSTAALHAHHEGRAAAPHDAAEGSRSIISHISQV